MKNAFRHTGVMLMVAVVGLAVIGAGYALWFQVLTLNATVTTGTLDVVWSDHGAVQEYSTDLGQNFLHGDNGTAVPAITPSAGFLPAKAVQTCTQTLDATGHVLTISDLGLYPYAGCVHHIDIHSVGTVPVHIDTAALDFSGLHCEPAASACGDPAKDLTVKITNCVPGVGSSDVGGGPNTPVPGKPSIWQLHQSNRIDCGIELVLNQSAKENVGYSGTIKLLACQWNEDPCTFADKTAVIQGRDNNETPTATPPPGP